MERIKLDLVPGGCKPILHASQYDIGRQWWIELLNNGVPYVLQEDDVVEYEIRKGDGLVVTGSIAYIPGATYVILVSTEQMCAIYGSNLGELKISSNGAEIGTGNFILDVEKATTGGEKSKSVIWDLQAQVDDCTQKALENIGAKGLPFDNEDTDLEATNTEDAIKEVDSKVNEKADASSLAEVATSGSYNDLLDKPSIPAAQVNSDWDANSGVSQILNKPNLATVATSGDYNDLNNKPSVAVIDDTQASANKTYSSNKIKSDVDNVAVNYNSHFPFYPNLDWELGFLNSDGKSTDSTTRIRTTTFHKFDVGTVFKITDSNVKYRIYFYTSANEDTYIVDSMSGYWHDSTEEYIMPLDHANYFVKILLAYSDDSTVTNVATLSSKITVVEPATSEDYEKVIDRINANLPILSISQDTMASGDTLTLDNYKDFSKNTVQEFYALITSFNSLTIGHGGARFMGNDVLIDSTNVSIRQGANSEVLKTVAHGLTISDFIYVLLEKDDKTKVKVTIMTASGTFTTDCLGYYGVNGQIFASTTSSLTKAMLKFTSKDLLLDTFVFGDSYITLNDNSKYMTQLVNMGFANKLCTIGYGGAGSSNGIRDFRNIMSIIKPKRVVWGLGMNDSDTSTAINSTWKAYLNEVIAFCNKNSIEVVLCTIPNTPTVINTFKNAYVKASGYRYIDFAYAVNAESTGATWYAGMLSNDNVHPTELGAKVLASRFLMDLPEIIN